MLTTKSITFTVCALALLCALTVFPVVLSAQTLPVIPENFITGVPQPDRTMSDIKRMITGAEMSAMVWDGQTPTLAWDDGMGTTGSIALPAGAVLPDVVLGTNALRAMVVYELTGNIYAQSYLFTAGNYVASGTPFVVSNTGDAATPNIDVNDGGEAVIVWAETASDIIRATCADVDGPTVNTNSIDASTTTLSLAGLSGADILLPDVAISTAGIVHITYNAYLGNNTHILYQVTSRTDICSGIISASHGWGFGQNPIRTVTAPDYLDRPRIAAHFWTGTTVSPVDRAALVWGENISGGYNIMSYNVGAGMHSVWSATCPAFRPAITMTGCGEYVVAWTYLTDQSCNDPNFNNTSLGNILSKRLNNYGVPMATLAQIVNMNYPSTTDESAPGLSGRFSQVRDINVSFWSNGGSLLMYKRGNCVLNPFFKQGSETGIGAGEMNLSLAPSPARNHLSIRVGSDTEIRSVRIYNLLGEPVYSKAFDAGPMSEIQGLDIESLSPGIYFTEIETPSGTLRERFVKSEQ